MGNGFHLLYEDMAIRHLHGQTGSNKLRTEPWLRRLEEFIRVNLLHLSF